MMLNTLSNTCADAIRRFVRASYSFKTLCFLCVVPENESTRIILNVIDEKAWAAVRQSPYAAIYVYVTCGPISKPKASSIRSTRVAFCENAERSC